mmetsp:Transcript_18169/g.47350  ORF Transcript_18169/g.47350 Transcript_18169/m.47350 type:complete len:235 (-) Transcript_18169:724-1428(-)
MDGPVPGEVKRNNFFSNEPAAAAVHSPTDSDDDLPAGPEGHSHSASDEDSLPASPPMSPGPADVDDTPAPLIESKHIPPPAAAAAPIVAAPTVAAPTAAAPIPKVVTPHTAPKNPAITPGGAAQYKSLNFWKGVQNKVKGIQPGRVRQGCTLYQNVVRGDRIVTTIQEHLRGCGQTKWANATRKQATKMAGLLLEQRFFVPANDRARSEGFDDSAKCLYHLNESTAEGAVGLAP